MAKHCFDAGMEYHTITVAERQQVSNGPSIDPRTGHSGPHLRSSQLHGERKPQRHLTIRLSLRAPDFAISLGSMLT
jgi:hypothetical protein